MVYVGIDVSQDRRDVHVLSDGAVLRDGDAFAVARDGPGSADLIGRLVRLSPQLVAVETTGRFGTVAAAALAGAGLPLVSALRSGVRHQADASGVAFRATRA